MKKSYKVLLAYILCAILACTVVIQVAALIIQSTLRKYPLTIRADNVIFLYNEKTYLDEIGSEEIELFKGEPTDIVMSVRVIGSRKIIVGYDISMELANPSDETAPASDITEAIEVYCFRDGKYEFLCMLKDIGQSRITGVMATNFDRLIHLRLVYSSTAGRYYDDIINGNNASDDGKFSIRATTTASINTESEDYVFAEDFNEFKEYFTSSGTAGKTIILTGNITVTENLKSAGKVGIDLNGRTLTLGSSVALTVDCNGDADKSAKRLGITNGDPLAGGLVIPASSRIDVINTGMCYLIDEFAAAQHSGAFNIDNGAVFSDFTALIRERTAHLADGRLYYNGTDVSFLFGDAGYYVAQYSMIIGSDSAIKYDSGSKKYQINIGNELTDKFLFAFIFTSGGADGPVNDIVSGYVTVRGNSPKAIADALVSGLPALITQSQYLMSYDSVTASYVDWHIDDGLSGSLLDDYGRYKKNGLDALIKKLIPGGSFNDRYVDVYVKVTKGAETGGADGGSWYYYRVKAEALSAAERTALIYNSLPAAIAAEKDEVYDIHRLYLIKDYKDLLAGGASDLVSLAGLTAINIVIEEDPQNYLEVVNTDGYENFNAVKIKDGVTVQANTLAEATLSVTFFYIADEGGTIKSYTISKKITVSGELSEITRYDMGYRLQSAFVTNPYVDGEEWWFYAYGALLPRTGGRPVAVLADYTVLGGAAEYISVTYEYVQTPRSLMEEGIAYFTYEYDAEDGVYRYITASKVNAQGEYDPDGEYPEGKVYYERKANIEILPGRITHVEPETVRIEVSLYTIDDKGNPHMIDDDGYLITDGSVGSKVYVDPVTKRIQALSYQLTLAVDGVIRNNPSQIEDTSLYYIFRQLFDANGDGVITYTESRDWEGLIARYNSGIPYEWRRYMSVHSGETVSPVYYINLSGQNIGSLKGLEYFPAVTGYDLSETGRADLSALSALGNLVYLNLSNTSASGRNAVTNLRPLAYMDKLEYLNLSYNKVINLESLRYLASLRYLNLSYNSVVDFEPLTEMTELRRLDITGMTTIYNANFTTDPKTMYDFALVSVNNPYVNFDYGAYVISITAPMKVAALVMRDLEEINRVRHVLYLPAFYYYNDNGTVKEYKLFWYTDVTETNLAITYAGGNVYYTIDSPVYDKPIRIYLKVYTGQGTETYDMSREFRLTLEATESGGLYIYDTLNGVYLDAYKAIPDDLLRNLIFDTFNHDVSNTLVTMIIDGQSVTAPERNVISASDFAYFNSNRQLSYNWGNRGIKDLTGIGLLRTIFIVSGSDPVTLNLTGNPFVSLAPLTGLSSLHTLTLGGNGYDFRELIPLSSLRVLNVYECLDLDTEESLKSLYALYCGNANLSIYLKAGTVWNPYALLLPKKAQNFPTTAAFTMRGDTFDLYEGKGSFSVVLYGVQYYFTVTASTIYSKMSSGTTFFTISNGAAAATPPGGIITYGSTQMYSSADTSYAVITIQSTVGDGRSLIEYDAYNVQLIANDASEIVYVHNVSGDGRFTVMTLGQLVGSRDLKSAALTRIFNYINSYYYDVGTATRRVPYQAGATMQDIYGFLTPAITATALYGTAGIYNSGGYNDAGAYSTSLTGRTRRHFSYFYHDTATGCYHITTDMLRNTSGNTNNSALTGAAGSLASASTLYIYGTYESGSNMLGGLRYFTGITTLYLYRDAKLGDGSELVNLTSLTIQYSCVDLTTIKTELPRLTTLSISYFYTLNAGSAADSALRFMPTLGTLNIIVNGRTATSQGSVGHYSPTSSANVYMYYLKDYSFLAGLIQAGNIANLTTLRLYGTLSSSFVSSENAAYVKNLWLAAVNNGRAPSYTIGSPTENLTATNGYFRVIGGIMCYCSPSNTDADKTASWEEAVADTSLNITDAQDYVNVTGAMRDLGLKINSGYWVNTRANTVSGLPAGSPETLRGFVLVGSDTLTLPSATGEDYYGLKFGAGQPTVRSYNITWTYWFINTSGAEATGTLAGGTYTVSSRFGTDGYLVLVGTITGNPAGTTAYSCFYHFIVGAGDDFYSTVTDRTLRAWLFAKEHGTSRVTDTIDISSNYTYGNTQFLSLMGLTKLSGEDLAENFIYSVAGIGNVVRQWEIRRGAGLSSLRNAITNLTFRYQRFTDISPLFVFEDVTTLYLYGSDAYPSWASLLGINSNGTGHAVKGVANQNSTIFRNLRALNVSYGYNIYPGDMQQLLSKPRPALYFLNFYHTNCMYNRIVIEYLRKYMSDNGTSFIDLYLNYGGYDRITLDHINNFLNDTDTSLSSNPYYTGTGINKESFIYANMSEPRTINGRNYAFGMTPYVNTFIRNYNICNAVPLKLEVTITEAFYRQFSGTYVNTVFRRNDVTAPMLFGTSSLPLVAVAGDDGSTPLYDSNGYPSQVNFDTELIAYLILTGALTPSSGSYRLTANVTIPATGDYGKGIASLAGALHATYRVAFDNNPNYVFALAYPYLNYTFTGSPSAANGSFPNTTTVLNPLFYIGSGQIITVYNYTGDNQPTYTAVLPSHIYYLGTLYPITWSITNIGSGITANSPNSILTRGANGEWIFTLSPDTISTMADSTNRTFRLTVLASNTAAVSPAPQTMLSTYLSITIRRNPDTSVSLGYDFFIEVEYDELSGIGGGLCDVSFKDGGNTYYEVGRIPYTMLYSYGGRYYTQNVTGSDPVYVIYANSVFESPRLAQYIYARYYANTAANVVLNNVGGLQAGYIMTKTNITAMTAFTLEYSAPGSSGYNQYYSQYVTSVEGIQIFYKMTSFTAKGGSFSDISPLASFSLEYFEYCNSYPDTSTQGYYGNNYIINDFSPLLEGSRDSLLNFRYNGGTVMLTDMNFLLAFSHLAEVYLGYAYVGTDTTTYFPVAQGLRYFLTPSGRYVLTTLWSRTNPVYIYAYETRATNAGLTVDKTKSRSVINYTYNVGAAGYAVYAILPTTEDIIYYEILSGFRSDMSNIEYKDGYLLKVTGGYTIGDSIALDLTSVLIHSGTLYLIDWRKAGGSLTVDAGYYLQKNITVNGVTYFAGAVTKEQAQAIADSVAFYEAYKSGANNLTARVTVSLRDLSPAGAGMIESLSGIPGLRLVCRIYHNEYACERMLTITF